MKVKILKLHNTNNKEQKNTIEYLYNNYFECIWFKFTMLYSRKLTHLIDFYLTPINLEGLQEIYRVLKGEFYWFEDLVEQVSNVHIAIDVQSAVFYRTTTVYTSSPLITRHADCFFLMRDPEDNSDVFYLALVKEQLMRKGARILYYHDNTQILENFENYEYFKFTNQYIYSTKVLEYFGLSVKNNDKPAEVEIDNETIEKNEEYIFRTITSPRVIPLLQPVLLKIIRLYTTTVNYPYYVIVRQRSNLLNLRNMFFTIYKHYPVLKFYMFLIIPLSNDEMKEVLAMTKPVDVLTFFAKKITQNDDPYNYLKKNLHKYRHYIQKAYLLVKVATDDDYLENMLSKNVFQRILPSQRITLFKYIYYTRDVEFANVDNVFWKTKIVNGVVKVGLDVWGIEKEQYVKLVNYIRNYRNLSKLVNDLKNEINKIRQLVIPHDEKIKQYQKLKIYTQKIEEILLTLDFKPYKLTYLLDYISNVDFYNKLLVMLSTITTEYLENSMYERKILEYVLKNFKIFYTIKLLKHSFFVRIKYTQEIFEFITKYRFHQKLKECRLGIKVTGVFSDVYPYFFYPANSKFKKYEYRRINLFKKVFRHYNTIHPLYWCNFVALVKDEKIYLHFNYWIKNNTVFKNQICLVKMRQENIYDVRSYDIGFEYILDTIAFHTIEKISEKYSMKHTVSSYLYVLENSDNRVILNYTDYLARKLTTTKSILPLTRETRQNVNILKLVI